MDHLTASDVAALIQRRDRAFKRLISDVGPPPRQRSGPVDQRFAALVRSITFQLLATKAAETIHGRVVTVCGGDVSVERVLHVGPDGLRTAGLSGTKASAMVELAEGVASGRIALHRHGRLADHEVIREVSTVRGIGSWTVQMYLMFTLARPDVWPSGDYGVRNGWSKLHGLDEIVSEPTLRDAGEAFVGVRSAVAWYCWRAVEG